MVFLNIKWPHSQKKNKKKNQVTNQPLKYSKDKFYSYKSTSGLPLCILTGEQEFHLESFQLASQDKIIFYRDLSSRIHSLYDW